MFLFLLLLPWSKSELVLGSSETSLTIQETWAISTTLQMKILRPTHQGHSELCHELVCKREPGRGPGINRVLINCKEPSFSLSLPPVFQLGLHSKNRECDRSPYYPPPTPPTVPHTARTVVLKAWSQTASISIN